MNKKQFDIQFFSLHWWLTMLMCPWRVGVLSRGLRLYAVVHFSCDTFLLIHHSSSFWSDRRCGVVSVVSWLVLVSALCKWVDEYVAVVRVYSYPLSSVSLSHLCCLYLSALLPHFSVHNVLQSIPNHTLSFSPSSQFIPCLTSGTSAKVLNAFTLTGSFLKMGTVLIFLMLYDALPVGSVGHSSQNSLYVAHGISLGPTQWTCVFGEMRRLWKSFTLCASAQPTHTIRKMNLLFSCNKFNGSLAAWHSAGTNWILNELTHPDGSVVLSANQNAADCVILHGCFRDPLLSLACWNICYLHFSWRLYVAIYLYYLYDLAAYNQRKIYVW